MATTITRILGVLLLLAATSLAAERNSAVAAPPALWGPDAAVVAADLDVANATNTDDADNACPDESAAVGKCGLGLNLLCPVCGFTAMGNSAAQDPNKDIKDAIADACDGLKAGSYCADLDKCIEDNCPEACKEPIRAQSACTFKTMGCDVCSGSAGGGSDSAGGDSDSAGGDSDSAGGDSDPAGDDSDSAGGGPSSGSSLLAMAAAGLGFVAAAMF